MNADEFIAARRGDWERLEQRLKRIKLGRMGGMSEDELEEFGRLYRAAVSDLAIARRDYPRQRVAVYLNQLVARAHPNVYRGEPLELHRVADFYRRGLPRLFRETAPYTLAAFLIFAVAGLAGFLTTTLNPDAAESLLPVGTRHLIPLIKRGQMWTDIDPVMRSLASSFIMTNNVQVAFLAFAGGVLLGLLTVYVLLLNGLLLGVIGGLCQVYGLSLPLWSFVLPHGTIELSVVFMAGGSGLLMGHALIDPGLYRRRDALARAARKAVRLIFGCVPLLVIAGLIEGFVSPSHLPPPLKILIGLIAGFLLWGYLLGAGHDI